MTTKQKPFDQVLVGLKIRKDYFSRDTIQASSDDAGLSVKRFTLSVSITLRITI